MKKKKKNFSKKNKVLICGIVLVVMFLIGGVIWFSWSTSLNSNQKNSNTKFLSKNNKFKDLNITGAAVLSEDLVFIDIGEEENQEHYFLDKDGNKYKFKDNFFNFSEGIATVATKDNKWGFINKKGEYVIKPQFGFVNEFSEGLAAVLKNDKYGFINKKGKMVIKPQFDSVGLFSEGLTEVLKNDKYGFINKKGKMVIKPQFDSVGSFSEGLAEVEKDKKYGFINKKGKMVIKPQFDLTVQFSEGLALVKKDNKWGFINKMGKMVIKPQFDSVGSFSEGLAAVEKDKKYGFINKKGKIVIKPQFDSGLYFSQGLAAVKKDDKWGFINKEGEFVIKPQFDFANPFEYGLSVVKKDEKYAFINKNGKFVIGNLDTNQKEKNNKQEVTKEEKIEEQSLEWFQEKYNSIVRTIFVGCDWVYVPPVEVEKDKSYVFSVISTHLVMTKGYYGGEFIPQKEFQDEAYKWFGIKDYIYEEKYNSEQDGYEVPYGGRVGLVPSPQITNVEYDGNNVKMNVKVDYSDTYEIAETRNFLFNIEYQDGDYYIKSIEEIQ